MRLNALLLSLTLFTAHSHAAMITWGSPTNITGDSDVSTTGTLRYAYDFNPTEVGATEAGRSLTTVNGVPFVQELVGNSSIPTTGALGAATFYGNGVLSGNLSLRNWDRSTASGTFSGSTASPFTGLSTDYQQLLGDTAWNNESFAARAMRANYDPAYHKVGLSFNSLTIGLTYQVQIFVSDSRASAGERNTTLSDSNFTGAGVALNITGNFNSVTLDANAGANGVDGRLGQYVIGTFTANAVSQIIEVTGGSSTNINAAQLRLVPEPSASLLMGAIAAMGLLRRRRA